MHADYFIFWSRNSKKSGKMRSKAGNLGQKKSRSVKTGVVVISGLEPPTHGFSVRCSTN